MEGIFPRSYAKVVEGEKDRGQGHNMPPPLPYQQQQQWGQPQQMPYHNGPPPPGGPGSYGNMPMQVAEQPQPGQEGEQGSKFNTQGKKFGKKLGNAAIFGAGASIGSNIVNGIL